MLIKNIVTTSHSRILKQQRGVVQESTQVGYQKQQKMLSKDSNSEVNEGKMSGS